jgi:hypothetical protein
MKQLTIDDMTKIKSKVAELFIYIPNQKNAKYGEKHGQWCFWNGVYWARDLEGKLYEYVRKEILAYEDILYSHSQMEKIVNLLKRSKFGFINDNMFERIKES